MTSELKPDVIITEVVCAGPKNYADKTFNSSTGESNTVCKVRGITLNYAASRLVNFDAIKELILGEDDIATVTVHADRKKSASVEGGE